MLKRTLGAAGAALLALASAEAAPANPLAIYTFEDGDASDSSGNGNDGNVLGGVTFLGVGSGHDGGRAASFSAVLGLSGIDTGIDINSSTLPALTMGAWVFADTFGNPNGPVTEARGKFLSHDNGGFDRTLGLDTRPTGVERYLAFNGGGGVVVSPPAQLGVWTHIAASWDGTEIRLYQDGVFLGAGPDNTDLGSSLFSLFIGTNPGFDEDWEGRIDDVFVYGRKLRDEGILDIYTNGLNPVPVPAAAILFAPALLALRRKRR